MSDAFEMDVADDLSRNQNEIENPGTYHLYVVKCEKNPAGRDGKMIEALVATVLVVDGTDRDASGKCVEAGKEIEIRMANPKLNHNDGGDFCKRVQSRFLYVTGLIGEAAKGKRVKIDLTQAAGRQFIGKFVQREITTRKGEKIEVVQLNGADMWHVDDGVVSPVPKSEKYLKSIPAELRQISGQEKVPEPPSRQEPATEYSEPVPTENKSAAPSFDDI